mgnify:CR=1 FL=1
MENKKENFRRIAENRTNKIIDMISLLGNLSNASFYEYTDEQINAIFDAIQDELDKQRSKFVKQKEGKKKRFELWEQISFLVAQQI